MKNILTLLLLLISVRAFPQQTRCDWKKIYDVTDPVQGMPILSPGFINPEANPLQYLITTCGCLCNKQVMMTGTIHYVGPQSFAVFHLLMTMPAGQIPAQTYWGTVQALNGTANFYDATVNVNTFGQVFLTIEDPPLETGTLINITMIFYIP